MSALGSAIIELRSVASLFVRSWTNQIEKNIFLNVDLPVGVISDFHDVEHLLCLLDEPKVRASSPFEAEIT